MQGNSTIGGGLEKASIGLGKERQMFVRRVFRQGNSTAVVIPTRYVDELGIRPGDFLAFDMTKGGGLRLRPLKVEDWTEAEKGAKEKP